MQAGSTPPARAGNKCHQKNSSARTASADKLYLGEVCFPVFGVLELLIYGTSADAALREVSGELGGKSFAETVASVFVGCGGAGGDEVVHTREGVHFAAGEGVGGCGTRGEGERRLGADWRESVSVLKVAGIVRGWLLS